MAALAALGGAAVYEAFGRTVVFAGTAIGMLVFLLAARWRFAVHLRHAAPGAAEPV